MFWWAVPVLYTGLFIFLVFGFLWFTFAEAMNTANFDCLPSVRVIVLLCTGIPCVIGFLMTSIGFFFWVLGNIWLTHA